MVSFCSAFWISWTIGSAFSAPCSSVSGWIATTGLSPTPGISSPCSSVTDTAQVASVNLSLLLLASIKVFPTALAVTRPFSSTVAIFSFVDIQITVLSAASSGSIKAISCSLFPFTSSVLCLFKLKAVTSFSVLFTLQSLHV